ncbi:excinuclease ABC subunit C [Candidatus Woesearchaeota archaeon]|nr:excinuclease ABC subunit C [Candidatus Woesearchaeota archaeon]
MLMKLNIPSEPGCYMFKDSRDKIIYIGKAGNLKKRVGSYFYKNDHDAKTKALIENISDIDYITTDNEKEALLLEDSLIKENQPKYNIMLKDAKSYAYILLTDHEFPRIKISRDKKESGKFFGPFISGEERDYIFNAAAKIFKIRTCKNMPKRPCLRYHMKICSAPCAEKISRKDYLENVENAGHALKGNTKGLKRRLEKKMQYFSENKMFEKAMEKRDQIRAIESLKERQKIVRQKKYNEDIINFIKRENRIFLMVFNIYKGTLVNMQDFSFDFIDGFLEEFLQRYYSENPVPKELILPERVSDALNDYLSEKKGSNVKITLPKIGEKKKLLKLIKKNIETHYFKGMKKTESLKKELGLKNIPHVIECFDISHISGTSTAGSMVQFRHGKPDKTNYRRFKLRTVKKADDYKSLGEVVRRRYRRLIKENREFPDLIIIDGGKGQLGAAVKELKNLSLNIPILSFAKQDDEIFAPGKKDAIILSKDSEALLFITEIIAEAHRFAIKYNKKLRSMKFRK